MIFQNFDTTWRTLEHLAAAGGTIPTDLLAARDARRFMSSVAQDLRDPESVVAEGLDDVDSEAAAQALLDDYIDAMTRREHAGHLSQNLDRLTCKHLEARLRNGGLDEILASARSSFDEHVVQPMQAYLEAVPTSSQAGSVINLGDKAVKAWREVQSVPDAVRGLVANVFTPLITWGGGLMPVTVEVSLYEKVAAFMVADGFDLRTAALATQQVMQIGVNDDPLAGLRTIGGALQLRTLSEARASVEAAEAALTGNTTYVAGASASSFDEWESGRAETAAAEDLARSAELERLRAASSEPSEPEADGPEVRDADPLPAKRKARSSK